MIRQPTFMYVQCHPHHLFVAPSANPIITTAVPAQEGSADASDVNTTTEQFASFPWHAEIDFMNDDIFSQPLQETIAINDTGVYIMMFVVCDPALAQVRNTAPHSYHTKAHPIHPLRANSSIALPTAYM